MGSFSPVPREPAMSYGNRVKLHRKDDHPPTKSCNPAWLPLRLPVAWSKSTALPIWACPMQKNSGQGGSRAKQLHGRQRLMQSPNRTSRHFLEPGTNW